MAEDWNPVQIKELLAGESLAARALEDSFDPVVIADLEGRILYANRAACETSGVAREEFVGKTDRELGFFISDEERAEVAVALRDHGRYGPTSGRFNVDGKVSISEYVVELVDIEGVPVVVSVSRGMAAELRALEELRSRDEILQTAAYAAQRFFEPGELGEHMNDVLERIVIATGVSRAYVYENSLGEDDELRMTATFEWCRPGTRSIVQEPFNQGYPYLPDFERWMTELSAGNAIHGVIPGLPDVERRIIESEDAESLAVVPIFVSGEWWGYIGLDDCEVPREWSSAELEALRVVAASIGAALGQRRVEEKLHTAELTFKGLVEQLPGAVYLETIAPKKTTLYASPRYEEMFGLAPQGDQSSYELWERIIHPDDLSAVVGESDRTDASGEPYVLEYRVTPAGKPLMWVRDEAILIHDDHGEPVYWLGLLTDITDRIRAEEELRSTEGKLRALVEQVPVAVYTQSPEDPENFYISPQVEKITGYTIDHFHMKGFWQSKLHPDDQDRVVAEARRTDQTGEPFDMEYRLVGPDGRDVWIHEVSVFVGPDEGRGGIWQGVFEDVTMRKEAEGKLRDAEERYRTLVERVPAVTYQEQVTPGRYPESTMMYMSPQAGAILGHPQEAFENDPLYYWDKVIHPDDLKGVVGSSMAATEGSDDVYEDEYRVVKSDGSIGWVRDEAVRVRLDEDGTQVWHGFLTDITKRKDAEEELERALRMEREAVDRLRALDEMKNTFLSAVSHDLRTPLAAIHGLALTLEREDIELEPVENRDLARRIAANSRKLERLITDLLDMDRLSRGILEPQLAITDLGALARKVIQEIDLPEDHSIEVVADPLSLQVDAAKVERMVENLIANSVRHTPPGTRVWVKVSRHPEGAILAVEDEGPGVPKEMQEAIFEPFRQGSVVQDPSPGVGIGLSLVARFAELHGGRTWVEDREGGGASFKIFLPAGPIGPDRHQ